MEKWNPLLMGAVICLYFIFFSLTMKTLLTIFNTPTILLVEPLDENDLLISGRKRGLDLIFRVVILSSRDDGVGSCTSSPFFKSLA